MTDMLKISIAQIAPTVGAIELNAEKILATYREAVEAESDLVVFPELILSGYPPEDLVLKQAYLSAIKKKAKEVAAQTTRSTAMIIGAPWQEKEGERPFNALLFCADGEIQKTIYKSRLPNYGVFDEPRRYQHGNGNKPIVWRGTKLGLMVCEDMWFPEVSASLKEQGAEILIAPHGSPFRTIVHELRAEQARARMAETGLPIIFVNQVGGQDELVFDGASFIAQDGEIKYTVACFKEQLSHSQWCKGANAYRCEEGPNQNWPTDYRLMYDALVLGVRDYVEKNRFPGVVLGLSGGVDSALTAAIAVDALGAERVKCVMLPYKYTSSESLKDAEECAAALRVDYKIISIEDPVIALNNNLASVFEGRKADVTEENIQSRMRGVILMALSNKFGDMLLTTGNKSEMSVGYATLYGDMNGGFNPLKDVYKTDVFALCHWRNENTSSIGKGPEGEVIPVNIITKPPSAELREDQKDEDSLPPYEVLDAILNGLIEDEASVTEIAQKGDGENPFDLALVQRIEHLLYVAEYKRRQAPPGTKITTKNFGRDRRYPITNGFRDR